MPQTKDNKSLGKIEAEIHGLEDAAKELSEVPKVVGEFVGGAVEGIVGGAVAGIAERLEGETK